MNGTGANAATTSAGAQSPAAAVSSFLQYRGVEYRCGDCGARNNIKSGDPVRCRQCGFRILYKMRTKRCKCRCGNTPFHTEEFKVMCIRFLWFANMIYFIIYIQ